MRSFRRTKSRGLPKMICSGRSHNPNPPT
jgi:hypothetical protein